MYNVDRNVTCLWMRPRSRPHVSSSLMLPTDDSLARYLAHHDRMTGNRVYRVIRWNIYSKETWADLKRDGIFKTPPLRQRGGEFLNRKPPSHHNVGMLWLKSLPVRELRGGKVAYRAHHLQARQVREIELRTHTQADVWEHGINVGDLTLTHTPPVTSASYLQLQLHFTEIGFLYSFEWAFRTVRQACSVSEQRVESENHGWCFAKKEQFWKTT